jgi:hypothetical protein
MSGTDGGTIPRILRLSEIHAGGADLRYALLHVVSGERHYLGWFQLSEDEWRVGLVDAATVVEGGVAADRVRAATERVLDNLRAAQEAGHDDAPVPIGPVTNVLRYRTDRRRAIARLQEELAALG